MSSFFSNRASAEVEEELSAKYLTKDELLASCDYIIMSLPSVKETYRFLDYDDFVKMKVPFFRRGAESCRMEFILLTLLAVR